VEYERRRNSQVSGIREMAEFMGGIRDMAEFARWPYSRDGGNLRDGGIRKKSEFTKWRNSRYGAIKDKS
jgi:hypothetical protein